MDLRDSPSWISSKIYLALTTSPVRFLQLQPALLHADLRPPSARHAALLRPDGEGEDLHLNHELLSGSLL